MGYTSLNLAIEAAYLRGDLPLPPRTGSYDTWIAERKSLRLVQSCNCTSI
jgi:hypothetical protein